MPVFITFFLLFILANTGFPGTINFVSELLLLAGVANIIPVLLIILVSSIFFSTIYSFWLFNRIAFGTIKLSSSLYYYDLIFSEKIILGSLLFLIFLGGIYPQLILENVYLSLMYILQLYN